MSRNTFTGYPSKDKIHLKNVSKKVLRPTVLPISFFGAFMLINSKRLSEPAIQEGEKIYSKQELHDDIITLVKSFKALSFRRGQRLAVITPNTYEGIITAFAANAMGIQLVYLNPIASDRETAEEIIRYRPDILLVHGRDAESIQSLYSLTGKAFSAIITQEPDGDNQLRSGGKTEPGFSCISFSDFKKAGENYSKSVTISIMRNLLSRKVSLFLQTSGSSSGRPKGLPFNNEAVFASMIYATNSSGTKTNDSLVNKVLCILPYRLPYGWNLMFMNIIGGNCVVLAQGASPEDIGNYYKDAPSYIYGTPVILRAFIENTPDEADLSFIKAFFASGFSLPETLYAEAKKFFETHNAPDAEIRNNYGIGEGLCIGTVTDRMPHIEGKAGRFWYGPDWVIVDDNLNEVKYGETGELMVHSKTLCKGYAGEPELTEKSFLKFRGKTYYRSGDSVSMDENGIVTFYGRIKRFYQPLGATDKVNCETIENAVSECPAVKSCAAVAVPDDELIQAGRVFAVLRDKGMDPAAAEEEIRSFISQKLLDYQMPKYICIIDEIPLMKSGKIDYTALEKM